MICLCGFQLPWQREFVFDSYIDCHFDSGLLVLEIFMIWLRKNWQHYKLKKSKIFIQCIGINVVTSVLLEIISFLGKSHFLSVSLTLSRDHSFSRSLFHAFSLHFFLNFSLSLSRYLFFSHSIFLAFPLYRFFSLSLSLFVASRFLAF